MDDALETLLQKTWHCALICEKCAAKSINTDAHGQFSKGIRLSLDCAEICMLLARSIKRESILLSPVLSLCEWICQQCADECSKHSEDHFQQCAAACLLCSEACRLVKTKLNQGETQND